MEKKEYAVGEEFQFGLKKLRCIEHHGCHGCIFDKTRCDAFIRDCVGHCSYHERTDATGVIFVEVK